ncbi:MAG: hypothetical protein ACE5EH_06485 [Gammaproteobacteria bacterium]
MIELLTCWNCGGVISDECLPFDRLAICGTCQKELHVCRMCQFYNPGISDHCDEPLAGQVRVEDRANFCDYFSVARGVYNQKDRQAADASKKSLAELFGDNDGAKNIGLNGREQNVKSGSGISSELEDLFKK